MRDFMMRWEPWDELNEIRRRMNELFAMMPFQGKRMFKELGKGQWYPAVDIEEGEKEIIVTAELPGLTEDDISINATEDSIEIKGERREIKEIEDKKAGYIRRERSFGKFQRILPLPAKIIPEQVEATFSNGLLKIVLPKAEKTKKKGINIKIKKEEE